MKKLFMCAVTAVLLIFFAATAYADSEIDGLYEKLPEEVKEEVEKDDVTEKGLLYFLSLENIYGFIKDKLFENGKKAISDLVSVASVIVVMMFANSLKSGLKISESASALNLVTTLVLGVTIYSSVQAVTAKLFKAVYDIAIFQNSLMAVLGAALATSGNATSAAILPTSIMVIINLFTHINNYVFLPLINVYFALIIAEGIFPDSLFSGAAAALKKFMVWGISACCTVLVGLIGMQKSITKASDSTLSGAVKLTISSAIPVIGGVMKDAYSAVAGSMSVIKASAGVLGIIAVAVMLLPIVITALIYMFFFRAAAALAGVSGDRKAEGLLKNISSIWDVLFAVVVAEGTFTVIAISILISIGSAAV